MFGFRDHAPQMCAVEELQLGAAGAAANFGRPGAADGSCEGAAPTQRKGAATLVRAGPPENLTFKIKFGAANICSKFEKFCQIFSAHSTSCIDDQPHHSAN